MNGGKTFGSFLRETIKRVGLSQSAFYLSVGITKPYFYDILSGKANPPPPRIQEKMISRLSLDGPQRNEFLDLAAEGRGEIPADIARIVSEHSESLDRIRAALKDLFPPEAEGKNEGA